MTSRVSYDPDPTLSVASVIGVKGIDGATVAGQANGLPIQEVAPTCTTATATIANGASLSDVVNVAAGKTVRGIKIPSAWTAAQISFDVSIDSGSTYASLRDPAGNEHVNAVTVDTFIPFPTVVGITNIKIRSGIIGALVAQGAQRQLTVLVA